MNTEIVNLSQIQVNGANPRIIRDDKFDKLIGSILVLPKMLQLRPIVVDRTMVALGGNMRFRALTAITDMTIDEIANRLNGLRDFQRKTEAEQKALLDYWAKWQDKPQTYIIKADELSDAEQREFIIKDNVGFGEWDMDALANEWDGEDLLEWGLDVWADTPSDMDGGTGGSEAPNSEPANSSLEDRFVIPPFSVLDTRKGYWQARKKMWRELIGDTGESREDKLITSPEIKYKDLYQRTRKHREELGITFREYLEKYVPADVLEHEGNKVLSAGVSLFDPVLSEIMCKWFTPHDGAKIFDCFAGDTQKGLVFAQCGFDFTGIELRQEQVDINNRVIADRGLNIRYICDDGCNVAEHIEANSQDLLFSCPPYYDLEKYSDLPNDASNQGTYEEFIDILRTAYTKALGCLKDDRFAVIVVGDVRSKIDGCYYDFCGDIKRIFKDNGVNLYNELILVETGASTALRAGRYMESRKVAKMHQNVLVFYKGDTTKIKKTFKTFKLTAEEEAMLNEEAQDFVNSDEAPVSDDNDVVFDTTQEDNSPENLLMKELVEFRKPYQKEGLIAYEHYPKIKQAIKDGDIYIERNPETGKIDGYLWMENLKKKPLSRIYEICSARKGLGRKLVELALQKKKHPTLQLWVVDFNDNAINFYKHLGFVEVERETGKKVNNLTMEYRG